MTEYNIENTVENEANAPMSGAEDIKEKDKEKMFSQSKLDEILNERISRERRTNEALSSVKNLLKNLSEKGLLKKGSYSEMAKEIISKLSEKSDTERVQDAKNTDGETTEVRDLQTSSVADEEGTNDKNAYCGNNDETEEKAKEKDFVGMLSGIKTKYPKNVVESLITTDHFERFAKGRTGSFEEILDDYSDFMCELYVTVKNDNDSHATLASTAFSSHSGAPDSGVNLTRQQMDIAKSAGMSYREYQNLLESIPKKSGRTF